MIRKITFLKRCSIYAVDMQLYAVDMQLYAVDMETFHKWNSRNLEKNGSFMKISFQLYVIYAQ